LWPWWNSIEASPFKIICRGMRHGSTHL
jgi:hypothetical protein